MKRLAIFAIATLAMIKLPFVQASDPSMVGSPAPTPAAIDQDGKPLDLAATYAKGITLVYFYPKADTPGCTAQACSLRDGIEDLKSLGVQVIGVSKDTPAAQKKFQEKYNLPFPLIADTDGKVAEAFGVGRILGFTSRTSFLVKDGKIAWVEPKAGTKNHAEQVKAALQSLKE